MLIQENNETKRFSIVIFIRKVNKAYRLIEQTRIGIILKQISKWNPNNNCYFISNYAKYVNCYSIFCNFKKLKRGFMDFQRTQVHVHTLHI